VGFVKSIGWKSWTGPVFLSFRPEIIKQINTRPSFYRKWDRNREDLVSTKGVQAGWFQPIIDYNCKFDN
jgi:hypothetical protein